MRVTDDGGDLLVDEDEDATEVIGLPIRDLILFALPFFLGAALIKTPDDLRGMMGAFGFVGLIHVPLILFEVCFSPQLHAMVYGYHQHQFIQTMRGSGFRPMCFAQHGLALAMFMHAVAWAINDVLGIETAVWVGFLIEAAFWLIVAGLAGLFAYKSVKKGTPPTPDTEYSVVRIDR